MIIVVAALKGGVGKTTTAVYLSALAAVSRRSATLVDADPQAMFPREASMAKLKATELAKRMTLEGVQMMGGYGYAVEYDMEHQLRIALATTIYGGTSEIQRDIIAKTYGL